MRALLVAGSDERGVPLADGLFDSMLMSTFVPKHMSIYMPHPHVETHVCIQGGPRHKHFEI